MSCGSGGGGGAPRPLFGSTQRGPTGPPSPVVVPALLWENHRTSEPFGVSPPPPSSPPHETARTVAQAARSRPKVDGSIECPRFRRCSPRQAPVGRFRPALLKNAIP